MAKKMKLYEMPKAPLLGELSSGSETERLNREAAVGSDAVKSAA